VTSHCGMHVVLEERGVCILGLARAQDLDGGERDVVQKIAQPPFREGDTGRRENLRWRDSYIRLFQLK
jgi:hypothetical protein